MTKNRNPIKDVFYPIFRAEKCLFYVVYKGDILLNKKNISNYGSILQKTLTNCVECGILSLQKYFIEIQDGGKS